MLNEVLSAVVDIVVQDEFPHTACDTVRKLDHLIAECDLVVHLIGRAIGSKAAPLAVTDFFASTSREGFMPTVEPTFFDTLTYMQWEPCLALHREIPVLVYGARGHDADESKHRTHLAALLGMRCHANNLMAKGAPCGQK